MGARRRREAAPQERVVLDAGAVLALANGNGSARHHLRIARARGLEVIVVPGAIAETVREDGPRNALVNLFLKTIDHVPPITEQVARTAGILLGRAGSSATVDALLVAEAISREKSIILTSDAGDISALVASRPGVRILKV